MEMVLFENVAPYYAEGIKNERKLVNIDKIAFVRESGTPEFPTLTLELQNGIMSVLEDLEQLDEPQKVIVPQFVAEYIEFKKKYDFHVYGAMREIEDHYDKRVPEWFYENNIETFVRAWLDGYEVEKEKRYKVVMPNVSSSGGVLTRIKHDDSWIWIDTLGTIIEGRTHTRKELEQAGFGWVFDCEGIEVEEVKG